MRSVHVSQKLSPYCHGELSEAETRRVAEHLMGCKLCRQEFEEIKLGVRLAEQLPLASAPANLWNEIEAALSNSAKPQAEIRKRRAFVFNWQMIAAACALLLLAIGAVWLFKHRATSAPQMAESRKREGNANNISEGAKNSENQSNPDVIASSPVANSNSKVAEIKTATLKPAWEVARLEGTPKVGAERIESNGRLGVGEWLETDATSRAQINVANIGQVEIEPNSRVRLVDTSSKEHRLAMERGQLHATISAPPRLFIVETPSAVAVDLGCSYTLQVDNAGRSILHVTTGWVALELKGRESIVPAGAVCVTQPGKGPGTPYFDDASPAFQDALSKLDFQNGGSKALSIVLQEAREYDTLTLWHLLSRVSGADRARVYNRMSELIPPPQGVTRDGVMKLDKGMLELWKKGLEWAWFG